MGWNISTAATIQILLGIIFIVVGNYLPKSRQNDTVGMKLPWTLADEDNWNKTHRLAGWLWVIGGLVLIANIFFKVKRLALPVIGVMAIIPMGYSFVIYKKKDR